MEQLRRHVHLLAYVILAMATLLTLALIKRESSWGDYHSCEATRDNRLVLREVIIEATDPEQALHITQIPSFQNLDPEDQEFWRDIERLSAQARNADDPNSFRQRAFRLLPIERCDHLKPWP